MSSAIGSCYYFESTQKLLNHNFSTRHSFAPRNRLRSKHSIRCVSGSDSSLAVEIHDVHLTLKGKTAPKKVGTLSFLIHKALRIYLKYSEMKPSSPVVKKQIETFAFKHIHHRHCLCIKQNRYSMASTYPSQNQPST